MLTDGALDKEVRANGFATTSREKAQDMTNKEVARSLEEIATLLELSGENPFKSRSYVNVARNLEQAQDSVETLVQEGRLREIDGVGEAIEKKISELVTTGRLEYLEGLRKKFPESLFELFRIPGLGAKRIKQLYEELNIVSLDDLAVACTESRLTNLKGFGPKMQQKVLDGLAFARRHQGQSLYAVAFEQAKALKAYLAQGKSVVRIEVAGSLRRCKEMVKDIDILASSTQPESLMQRFVEAPGVASITGHGDTKSSVVLECGIAADLRVVSDTEFPYALHHFTGSREHNVAMRQRAKDRGLKMNEYGLFRGEDNVPCADEAAIFAQLGLPYIPPELREDMGEIEAQALPRLVEAEDLVGLYHCHTTYSDGTATIEAMVKAAQRAGYAYVTITDHSRSAGYAGGLSEENISRQQDEIDTLNRKLKRFRILKGIESDIRNNGALDYDAAVLESFDLVIVSVHSNLDMDEATATRRVVKALENPAATILGHPTGRLLLARQGYPLDMDTVLDACAANGVAIEINAAPNRLDLDWRHVRRARDKGVKLCIGADAHSPETLEWMRYGLNIARKGWCGKDDLLNCMTVEEFLAWRG